MYCGASPFIALNVNKRILNMTLLEMGSQPRGHMDAALDAGYKSCGGILNSLESFKFILGKAVKQAVARVESRAHKSVNQHFSWRLVQVGSEFANVV